MIQLDIRSLVARLNSTCTNALEGAAGLAVSREAYEVQVEHLLQKMVEVGDGDVVQILRAQDIDPARLVRALAHDLDASRRGNAGRPVWSPLLLEWLSDAWLVASVDFGADLIRTGHLLLALLKRPGRYVGDAVTLLGELPAAAVQATFAELTAASSESRSGATRTAGAGSQGRGSAADRQSGTALERFTIDLTARAEEGAIDPIFGREREIRQMVDILARRRKNNPIVVGEAGVGKTALIEGLALDIAAGRAPLSLRGVRLLTLDMGLLQAGAGMKGEFENRLNQVILEVKASEVPIVLFIDEAHTMIGAGGAQGGGDAANLLKPALARGELRTIAATTWSEYKKYFEKDPALSRRFQLVKVGEPDEERAIGMLRGIAPHYEASHGVRIYDEAVLACARLGSRYLTGRQHPDKGVDLLDTAAARVKLAHSAVPAPLEDLEQRHAATERELEARRRDVEHGVEQAAERVPELEASLASLATEIASLRKRWERERDLVRSAVELRRRLASNDGGAAEQGLDEPEADLAGLREELEGVTSALAEAQENDGLVQLDVNAQTVAEVIADWTGIPVGNMVRDEARTILEFEARLKERIKGQDQAVAALGKAIRASKAGVGNPDAPIGVFLAVGTSGVGKTECGLGLADLLFGGDRFLTTINMSEFQEKHTVSRLIGSPPGYVGFGEGGLLTEAVRKSPYSVVLLDEVEKADPDVMNLFYQVFDKGTLADGEGREVDFRNTIVYLTSNLGTDLITSMCSSGVCPSTEQLSEAFHPVLAAHFKPALLARMTVVPFFPIGPDVMTQITRLKLDRLTRRVQDAHRMRLTYSDEVVARIVDQCTQVDTGARNIDHILRGTLMPQLSTEILTRMSQEDLPGACAIGLGNEGTFAFDFEP